MRITKSQLRQIIKEELDTAMEEGFFDMFKRKKDEPEQEGPTFGARSAESIADMAEQIDYHVNRVGATIREFDRASGAEAKANAARVVRGAAEVAKKALRRMDTGTYAFDGNEKDVKRLETVLASADQIIKNIRKHIRAGDAAGRKRSAAAREQDRLRKMIDARDRARRDARGPGSRQTLDLMSDEEILKRYGR